MGLSWLMSRRIFQELEPRWPPTHWVERSCTDEVARKFEGREALIQRRRALYEMLQALCQNIELDVTIESVWNNERENRESLAAIRLAQMEGESLAERS